MKKSVNKSFLFVFLLFLGATSLGMRNALAQSIIALVGPPASGKSSFAKFLAKGWTHLPLGSMIQSYDSDKVEAAVAEGRLLDDDFVCRTVLKPLICSVVAGDNLVIDGFPRTPEQAEWLHKLLECLSVVHEESPKFCMVMLSAGDDVVIDRIVNRHTCCGCGKSYILTEGSLLVPKVDGICDKCSSELMQRIDDNPEAIDKRLEMYRGYEDGLREYFLTDGWAVDVVEGSFSIDRPLAPQFERLEADIMVMLEG